MLRAQPRVPAAIPLHHHPAARARFAPPAMLAHTALTLGTDPLTAQQVTQRLAADHDLFTLRQHLAQMGVVEAGVLLLH